MGPGRRGASLAPQCTSWGARLTTACWPILPPRQRLPHKVWGLGARCSRLFPRATRARRCRGLYLHARLRLRVCRPARSQAAGRARKT